MSNNNTISNINTSEIPVIVYICIHLVMPCAVAIGVIGNLLSILVFSRREMIKFCVSILTIILALSDILFLTTSLFNIILPDFLGGLLSDKSAFWCHFHGYFDLLFAALSGYSVVFISIERWLSVWKPFDKTKYVTFKSTLITVISYTTISIVIFLWFPLTLKYNPSIPKSSERCTLLRPIVYKICGTISVIFTYIAPFIFLGILNILIIYRLHARQHGAIQRSIMSITSVGGIDPSLITASARKRLQRQRNADRNITFMLITVAIAFMVMSFPFQIYWFYMQIRQLTVPNKTLFTLTQTFRNLNCCCNFFLYSATSSLFRRELREIFQCTNSFLFKHHDNNIEVKPRARTLSASLPLPLPIQSINKNDDQHLSENQQLLLPIPMTTIELTSSTRITGEDINLTDSINGHSVSFQA